MPDAYQILNVPIDADDAAIRKRYLELVRQFPPEQHPEQFAAVRKAYENIRTLDARAHYRLFVTFGEDTIESVIEELECRTVPTQTRYILKRMMAALHPSSSPLPAGGKKG